MRLNVAQRAGIVASVLCFVVLFCWSFLDQSATASKYASMSAKICEQTRDEMRKSMPGTPPYVADHCWDSFEKDYATMTSDRLAGATIAGAILIPFGWLFAWLIVRTVRWVRFGRWRPQK